MENFPPNFVEDFLSLHNDYRSTHGSPPLQIEDEINERAQEWAEILAQRGALAYRADSEYGENIYVSYWRNVPAEIKPKDPLESWYRDGRYFKYGEEPKNVQQARHFTQLVWMETKSVGFGMATGSDGKIYFVCDYSPPGNIPGEFTKNVLPLDKEEAELSEHDAGGIKTIDPQPKIVKSMERLYAVPSEKLRVWTVWLAKIGDVAYEWQRWLRSHIDFTVRLSEQLQRAQDQLAEDERPEVSSESYSDEKVDSERGDDTSERTSKQNEESSTLVETTSESQVFEDVAEEEEDGRISKGPEEEDGRISEGPEEEDSRMSKGSEATSKQTLTKTPSKSASKITAGSEEENSSSWPIGTPWDPLGPKQPPEEEPFERLPLPTNEEEMRELFRKFTHQATIYRSLYKHWSETADLAISDIGCRLVLATYVVQGKSHLLPKDRDETTEQTDKDEGDDKYDEELRERTESEGSKYFSAIDVVDSSGEDAADPPAEDADDPPAEDADDPPAEDAAEIDNSADDPEETNESSTSPQKAILKSKSKSKASKRSAKGATSKRKKTSLKSFRTFSESWCETVESFRDKARAAEPIPYFFYLRAEPDVDIAIEHDDEEFILPDPDRENILGDYGRLYFNLSDKPCTDGKPWI